MAETVVIGCPNGYQSGNPDWEAMWSSMSIESRQNFMAGAARTGLAPAGSVNINSSAAPTLNYVPGSPCYEAIREASRGSAQTTERVQESAAVLPPELDGESDSWLTLPGVGSHSLKDAAPYILLVLLIVGTALVLSQRGSHA